MEKTNFTVARVVTHTRAGVGKCERHNERKNENYGNMNVDLERTPMNIHFKDCGGATYNETLDRLVAAGEVSLRGLKADARVYDEMILDVNTDYFERHGGYDFAQRFYGEAYRFACKLYGEQNILSAVMHADEINLALTERYGYPVYHYHLHIVALPVVEKQVLWSKRCRDKALVGTVKETVQQVSHSKKWKSQRALDENGKPSFDDKGRPKLLPSYSVLQDEFCDHMKEAGFTDFIRGERGSTEDNLSCLQYQIKKDTERLEEVRAMVKAEEAEYEAVHLVHKTHAEIDDMGKKTLTGKVTVSQADYDALTQLAKEGVSERGQLDRLKEENRQLQARVWSLQSSLNQLERQFDELVERCRPYLEAVRAMPEKVKEFLDSILAPVRRQKEEQSRSIMYGKSKTRERRDDAR